MNNLAARDNQSRTNNMPNDNELVMIFYAHPNRGQHKVVGAVTKTDYGYRAYGDEFYVTRQDASAAPDIFQVKPTTIETPEKTIEPPPEPEPIVKKIVEDKAGNLAATPVEEVEPDTQPVDLSETKMLQILPGVTAAIETAMNAAGIHSVQDVHDAGVDGLVKVPGIGQKKAESILKYINSYMLKKAT